MGSPGPGRHSARWLQQTAAAGQTPLDVVEWLSAGIFRCQGRRAAARFPQAPRKTCRPLPASVTATRLQKRPMRPLSQRAPSSLDIWMTPVADCTRYCCATSSQAPCAILSSALFREVERGADTKSQSTLTVLMFPLLLDSRNARACSTEAVTVASCCHCWGGQKSQQVTPHGTGSCAVALLLTSCWACCCCVTRFPPRLLLQELQLAIELQQKQQLLVQPRVCLIFSICLMLLLLV